MKPIIAFVLAAFVLAGAVPIVELTIKERAGIGRTGEPVTAGVPLPDGMITDLSVLALTDQAGNQIDCEFRKAVEVLAKDWQKFTPTKAR